MQDRRSKYPGRVKLIPVAGQENTYDLIRADEAIDKGTKLSKENLLSDSTAESLGLGKDATVNDALRALSDAGKKRPTPEDVGAAPAEHTHTAEEVGAAEAGHTHKAEEVGAVSFEVGDTIETYRKDLDDSWLPCNGEAFSAGEYPQLAQITPGVDELASLYSYITPPGTSPCTEGGGYQAYIYRDNYGVYVKYSNDGFKTYETATLYKGSSSTALYLYPKLFYVNGYWIAVFAGLSSQGYFCCYYTSDITQEWTKGIDTKGSFGAFYDLWYYNGAYYLAAASAYSGDGTGSSRGTTYAKIISSTSPGFKSVTYLDVGNINVKSFIRTENEYVFIGTSSYKLNIAYAPVNAPKTYTLKSAVSFVGATTGNALSASNSSDFDNNAGKVTYIKGLYIFCFSSRAGNSTSNYTYTPVIAYTDDITADTWKCFNLTEFVNSGEYMPMPSGPVAYVRGKYIIPAYYVQYVSAEFDKNEKSGFYFTDNIKTNKWTFVNLTYNGDESDYMTVGGFPPIVDDKYVSFAVNTTANAIVAEKYIRLPIYAVPKRDSAPLCKYIKAREDV